MVIIAHTDPNRRIGIFELEEVFNPDIHDINDDSKFVPKIRSLVVDQNGSIFRVVSVDEETYRSTLSPASIVITDDTQDDQISVENYQNNIFACYLDDRNLPVRVVIDSRLVIYGQTESYQLFINYQTEDERVVSSYYDTDGSFISNSVPMIDILSTDGTPSNAKYPRPSHTQETLADGTRLTMVIYNAQNSVVATTTLFTKRSTIQSSETGNQPVISNMSIIGNQSRGNDEFFVIQNQDIEELNLRARLTYDDGGTVEVPVDNQKLHLYGAESFFPSWIGLRQPIMMKYFLSFQEAGQPEIITNNFITSDAYLVVTPAASYANVKISVIPYWVAAANEYRLRYFLYSADRTRSREITSHVTISTGTFVGNAFGDQQSLTLRVNLNEIDSTTYPDTNFYEQNVVISLQPPTSSTRWIIQDTPTSEIVYGAENPAGPRPRILYSPTSQRYRIPSTLFRTTEFFLTAFYTYGQAPFDPTTEEQVPQPTHFTFRDIQTGDALLSSPVDINDFSVELAIIGAGSSDRYVNTTILVEFILRTQGGNTSILYGVPVEVSEG